jgi:hypothetical protein
VLSRSTVKCHGLLSTDADWLTSWSWVCRWRSYLGFADVNEAARDEIASNEAKSLFDSSMGYHVVWESRQRHPELIPFWEMYGTGEGSGISESSQIISFISLNSTIQL